MTGTVGKRIGLTTPISDEQTYCVVGTDKEDRNATQVKTVGSYDHCADYATRNESPDNYERYDVHEYEGGTDG